MGQNRGNLNQKDLRKIRKICDLQPTIGFTEFDIYNAYLQSFHQSELGAIYRSFPFSSFAHELGLKDQSLGRDSYFSAEGKIALMVLKSYSGFSDRGLIRHQCQSSLPVFLRSPYQSLESLNQLQDCK